MADDIVSFGMEIDSSAAQKAKEDLMRLANAGPEVEQALNRLKNAGASGAAGVSAVSIAAAKARAETDRMRQAMIMANSTMGALTRSLGGLVAIGGIGGTLSLGAIFGKFISETKNAQMEQAQLAAVLKSTGMAAGFTRAELNAMAFDMAAMSTFTAGEINQAQTRLLSYSNIAHEMFPRAMQAVIDTSIRMGMSVTQAAETVGRALDIPSEGLASLSRQGFRFTDEQKKMAKALEDTGRIAEAQGIVIEALESSYGGAAAAARNTLGGALQALQNQISDLMAGDDDSVRGLTQGVNDLTYALSSEETKRAFADFGGMLLGLAGNFAQATAASRSSLIGFAATAEGFFADSGGSFAEAQRLRQEIEELENAAARSDGAMQWVYDKGVAYRKARLAVLKDQMNRDYGGMFPDYIPQLAPNTVKPAGGGSKSSNGSKRKVLYDSIEDWMGSADGMARLTDVEKQYNSIGDLIENRLNIAQTKYNRELEAMGQGDWARQVNSALQEIRDKYQDLLEQRRNSTAGLSEQDEVALKSAMEREEQMAVDHYAKLKETQGDWSLGAMDALRNYQDESANVYQSIGDIVNSTFKGMEDVLTEFAMTGKMNFADLANSIIRDMIRMQVQASITGPLAGMLGGGLRMFGAEMFANMSSDPIGSLIGSLGGAAYNAKGGVYDSPSLSAYSNQIHDTPKLFAFARGAGVFGEAGPEAIMPLKRGPDGRLGVSTAGGGGGNMPAPIINITNTGTPQGVQGQPHVRMDDMGRWVIDIVMGDIRQNGRLGQTLRRGL